MLLCLETNCQMRTLDSGIGTFPLPDSGTRAAGRYIRQADSPEDTDPILSLQPALCAASSMRAQTLEREVPSSADSQRDATSSESPPQTSLLRYSAPYLSDEIVFSSKSCTCWQKWKTGSRKDSHQVSQWPLPIGSVYTWNPFMSSIKKLQSEVKALIRDRHFATPWTVACQALLSVGFSRQEYGVGCHCLLQGIFPTQGLNPGLPHCRKTL